MLNDIVGEPRYQIGMVCKFVKKKIFLYMPEKVRMHEKTKRAAVVASYPSALINKNIIEVSK